MILSAKAYAKTNLTLDVTAKRDDGYHILDTVMQSVSVFDTVTVKTDNSQKISVFCGDDLSGENNICYAAAQKYCQVSGFNKGIRITVEKGIPVAAGMGGGSCDAAAVLNLMDKMSDNPLGEEKLCEIGLTLGADVPFALIGGTARVKGIGEKVERIKNNLNYGLVFIKDGIKLSTAQMYKQLDTKIDSVINRPSAERIIAAIKNNDFEQFCRSTGNVFDVIWDNEVLKNKLISLGAKSVFVSGSGPTILAIFENATKAISCAAVLREEYPQVYSAVPVNTGMQVI